MLDDESPTSTNLRNDHEFIIKEYYHTIVESPVHRLTGNQLKLFHVRFR